MYSASVHPARGGTWRLTAVFGAVVLLAVFAGARPASAAGPGICSNNKAVSCSTNSECAGGTCYLPTPVGQLLQGQVCMQQAAGFGLNCTANDVSIAATTNLIVSEPCSYPGDTAIISFVAKYQLTAQLRFDVGAWIAQDGGNAYTGRCAVSAFPTAPDPPWFNGDPGSFNTCSLRSSIGCTKTADCYPGGTKCDDDPETPEIVTTCSNARAVQCTTVNQCNFGTCTGAVTSDTCGDIDNTIAHNPLYSSVQNIEVTCLDNTGDGLLDINTCLSWRQSGANELCTSPLQAFPGSPSKCKCQQLPGIEVQVPPVIKVDKVTYPAGDTQSFAFTLSGGASPVNFSLTDAALPWNSGALQPNRTYSVAETVPTNWDQTSATCRSNQAGRNPTPGSIPLQAGEEVTCTFTNTKRGSITVDKVTNPTGDTTEFSFSLTGGPSALNQSFKLTDASTPHDSGLIQPTTSTSKYSIAEVLPSDWANWRKECSNGSSVTAVTVAPGESVLCTFYNAGPTAVDLKWFEATGVQKGITLGWETSTETDNLGFNLYRATAEDGPRTKINTELIPTQNPPGSTYGAVYTYPDTTVSGKRTYFYWLEDVDIYGGTSLHGPVSARPQ